MQIPNRSGRQLMKKTLVKIDLKKIKKDIEESDTFFLKFKGENHENKRTTG